MSVVKTKGLVIKEVNIGEADKIITIFTERYGKIQASVQGVRRPRSRLIAGTQILCFSNFVLYKGKSMYRVNQSEVIESFYNIRNSIEKLSYASYFMELTLEVIEEGYSDRRLLKLLLNTLYMLSKTDKDPKLLKIIYELRLMSIIGYAPNLTVCTHCGEHSEKYYFNSEAGGILCEKCVIDMKNKRNFTLREGTLYAMRYILYIDKKKLFSFKLAPKIQEELDIIIQDFLLTHIQKKLKSKEFLDKILKL